MQGRALPENTAARASWRDVAITVFALVVAAALLILTSATMTRDIDARDENARTALHRAAMEGDAPRAKALLIKGADVNAPDKHGRRPLHLAAHAGHVEVTELLLQRGAVVNIEDGFGERPLSLAVGEGHTEVAALVQAHGAEERASLPRGCHSLPSPTPH